MRTTVRLDTQLLRQAKKRAAESGRTLTALIEEGLRLVLTPRVPVTAPPLNLPVSGAGGLRPGVDLDDTAALYDLMDAAE